MSGSGVVVVKKKDLEDSNATSTDDVAVRFDLSKGDWLEEGSGSLSRDEVLAGCDRPLFHRLRLAFHLVFWALFFGLIAAVMVLSMQHPECEAQPQLQWWQDTVFYKVYVRSFKDTDGDGVGDIRGVLENINYISSLGVGAVVLTGVIESGSKGILHDTTNFKSVSLGTPSDMADLISAAHDEGLKVVVEFCPNQVGTTHAWFTDAGKDQYFIRAGPATSVPNNWVSVYDDGPAWNTSGTTTQQYLHQFSKIEADLNVRNNRVQDEIADALQFWVAQGVDGFHMTHLDYLYEDYELRDEDPSGTGTSGSYASLVHNHTRSLPANAQLVSAWRLAVKQAAATNGSSVAVMAEVESSIAVRRQYCDTPGSSPADLVYNSQLQHVGAGCGGTCVSQHVDMWLQSGGADTCGVWQTSEFGGKRLASRFQAKHIRVGLMLSLLLPGVPMLTYGDELGQVDLQTNPPMTTDSGFAVPSVVNWRGRAPMAWDGNGNFSSANPWLPLPPNVTSANVKSQDGDDSSILALVQEVIELRREPAFRFGHYHTAVVDENIFSFIRQFDGVDSFLVGLNFGNETATAKFSSADWPDMASEVEIVATSLNGVDKPEDDVDVDDIALEPGQGFVAKWSYRVKEPTEYL